MKIVSWIFILENSENFLQSVSLNNANVLLLTQQMFSTVIESHDLKSMEFFIDIYC
jgi:hypothetical protein